MRMRGFKYAKQASQRSDFHDQNLGAVILYSGKVLSLGYNSEKTHSKQGFYNRYRNFDTATNPNKIHAEMMALNKIQYLDIDFSRVELYVYRECEGKPALSRPCPACEARIRAMGIKHVYYTGDNSYCEEKYV